MPKGCFGVSRSQQREGVLKRYRRADIGVVNMDGGVFHIWKYQIELRSVVGIAKPVKAPDSPNMTILEVDTFLQFGGKDF